MEKHEQGFNINMPTAVVIAGFLVAVAIYASGGKTTQVAQQAGPQGQQAAAQQGAPAPTTNVKVNPISRDDHYYGSPNAKIVLVEFSDLECPFCKRFQPIAKELVDSSNGKVALVFRHFPLDQLHSKARNEAQAAECVATLGGNDKFWKYIDLAFETTPGNNGLDPAELPKMAVKVGIDKAQFESCLASNKDKDKIQANVDDGAKAGVQGTPTTVIMNRKGDNVLLVGAQPKEAFQSAIDGLLK